MILRTALLLAAVASLFSFSQSSEAAFLFYQTKNGVGGFDAAVPGGLATYGSEFDSIAAGTSGNPLAAGGLTFSAINRVVSPNPVLNQPPIVTINPLPVAVNAADPVGSTTSPPNFLGAQGASQVTRDFAGSPIPLASGQTGIGDYGNQLIINVPAGTRAVSLNVLIDEGSVVLGGVLGRLSLGTSDSPLGINTVSNAEAVLNNGYRSFFLGVVGTTPADLLPSQVNVFFEGGFAGFRVDNVRAFAPIPEPSSMALVGVLGLFGLVRRRARRS